MQPKALTNSPDAAFALALRIRHPSLDPAALSQELGMEPTHSFRAGQPRASRSDPVAASVHAESYWLGAMDRSAWLSDTWLSGSGPLESAVKRRGRSAWKSLGSALVMATRSLVLRHAPLFKRIRDEGGQVSLLVSLSPLAVGSFSVPPEVSRILGDLGITVEFELTGD